MNINYLQMFNISTNNTEHMLLQFWRIRTKNYCTSSNYM